MSKARELAELGAVYDSGALSNRNMINQRGNDGCLIKEERVIRVPQVVRFPYGPDLVLEWI